jgi:hypothetical protein
MAATRARRAGGFVAVNLVKAAFRQRRTVRRKRYIRIEGTSLGAVTSSASLVPTDLEDPKNIARYQTINTEPRRPDCRGPAARSS